MMNDKYLEKLEVAIERLHDCKAVHVDSVPVHEIVHGQRNWDVTVEIFSLIGHPQAKRCFAWSHREGQADTGQPLYALLEIPPIDSPQTAVHVTLVSVARKRA